ncbi:cupin domain-containing protein [Viridibacillus arvi]|uniref:Cupin type-2 domain-containing protein n=2 Tax=Viridibacillus arvi TaxID=263475 RepID=A0A0M0LDR7_9BACL|nr:cupin domain-containing protein [Viridibacillus arvi]KOO49091.1 hypothetical protein AMD00_11900 [Viridibacillus arvi]
MQIFNISKRQMNVFDSDFQLSHICQTSTATNISLMTLEENGVIGNHQTVTNQLLIVLNGTGNVVGKEGGKTVGPGDVVFWDKGEWHETTSECGMQVMVIESDELRASDMLSLKMDF